MKVSVVITVKNEAATIRPLIESLLKQTKKPDEIIVVNAGSTDGIKEILQKYSITFRECDRETNRSQGRNAGIRAAKNKIIAVTDAGCRPHKDWLKLLTAPFKDKKVKSVAGYYRPITKTLLQEAIAPFLAVMPDQFDDQTYLPSSRSVAFKKGIAWYPEKLNYCEDLVFARELTKAGKMVRIKEALVDWEIPATLAEFFNRVKNYASGDVAARYWPHLVKILTVWLRYLIFIGLPPLLGLYLIYPIAKLGRYVPFRGWIYLPLLQLTADWAVITGSLKRNK